MEKEVIVKKQWSQPIFWVIDIDNVRGGNAGAHNEHFFTPNHTNTIYGGGALASQFFNYLS